MHCERQEGNINLWVDYFFQANMFMFCYCLFISVPPFGGPIIKNVRVRIALAGLIITYPRFENYNNF